MLSVGAWGMGVRGRVGRQNKVAHDALALPCSSRAALLQRYERGRLLTAKRIGVGRVMWKI